MFIARISYDILPRNRQTALQLMNAEVAAAIAGGRSARILTPVTRGHGCAALQFELEVTHLDDLEQFRKDGIGDARQTRDWMQKFDDILESPPVVEIFRISGHG